MACSDDVKTSSSSSSDDDSSGGAGGTTSAGNGSANGGSTSNGGSSANGSPTGVGGSTGSGVDPCQEGCDALYNCTQLDNDGEPICPGLKDGGADIEAVFVEQCLGNSQCGLIGMLVGDGTDPGTCATAIDLIGSMSTEFAAACAGEG